MGTFVDTVKNLIFGEAPQLLKLNDVTPGLETLGLSSTPELKFKEYNMNGVLHRKDWIELENGKKEYTGFSFTFPASFPRGEYKLTIWETSATDKETLIKCNIVIGESGVYKSTFAELGLTSFIDTPRPKDYVGVYHSSCRGITISSAMGTEAAIACR
jgi:hypothetical protein